MGAAPVCCCCVDDKDSQPVVVSHVIPLQGDAASRPVEATPPSPKMESKILEIVYERTDKAAKWGLEMRWSRNTGTVVQAILPGIVSDWNDSHPLEEQVQPGFIVQSVNDETDPKVMANHLATRTGEFRIRFQAPMMALV
mmetsp:Transcript_51161/g.119911  ORF Transcript_51161/g.119911 Transcript_51161/m.119911 type:complete len:140 (-) Transcript_51161:55-474(-)